MRPKEPQGMILPFVQQTPTPNFDRPFLNEVKESFHRLWNNPDALPYLVATFLAVGIVIILGVLYNQFVSRRRYRSALPAGWFVDPGKIREIMETALDQRSKIEMRFLPAEPSRRSTSCSLLELGVEALTLELPDYVESGPSWLHREVECFFRVPEEKGQISFYRFTSVIQNVSRTVDGFAQAELAFPKLLHNHQKRNFLRIAPPAYLFLGVAMWLERRLPTDEHGCPAANLSSWGKPMFTYIPDKNGNPVRIANISAGGLRLDIERSAVKGREIELRVSDRIVILLDLYDPELERKQRFWLRCRVQNMQEDYDTRNLELGVQFVSVGRLAEDADREVRWHDVGEDGIEPLAVWVMQRHLELFREKGLD
ncbi:PilZ domain-containing protein [Oceanidesulfovibrio marinus]|uniref:PilZ domain-containing protein n=2 Tax=Oceanidesulfovibrio marinus TaxID=370038 RepID=A0ABX6NCH1_9BACT|nr:PilZ domain-containing protein [Oceanidesulfovibrio marinus]